MSLRVASLDARWALGDPERGAAVMDSLLLTSPDAIFIQEACHEDDIRETGAVVANILRPHGFGTISGHIYQDADNRADRHAALLAVKSDISGSVGWISTGFLCPTNDNKGRFVPMARLRDPATMQQVRLAGMHADDRSAEQRFGQYTRLLDMLDGEPEGLTQPTVLLGVGNYMHPDDMKGLVWRAPGMHRAFHYFVPGEPHAPQTKFQRAISIGRRFTEMAMPEIAELIESRGFVDADPLHEATLAMIGDKIPLVNTAHILSRNADVTDFRISYIRGVQHRAVSATIHVA